MPQLPFILAIEPDRRQSSKIASLARNVLHAELHVVETADDAAAAIATRVPDLILTSLLLSPKDEATLSDTLRELDAAGSHVQTLVIPVLASTAPDADGKSGLFSKLRRSRTSAATPEGCDPAFFGAQIEEYLERAAHERALRAASPVADTIKIREAESAPIESWSGAWKKDHMLPGEDQATTATSSWDDPFSVTPPARRSVVEEAHLSQETEPIAEEVTGVAESAYLREVLAQPVETTEVAAEPAATSEGEAGWQVASSDEDLAPTDEPAAAAFARGEPSDIDPNVSATLIIEPTSYAAEAFTVATWHHGETSAAPSASLRTADGLEVLSVQALNDEGWEDVTLETAETASVGTEGPGSSEHTSAPLLVAVADPLPVPPEPVGSIDLGTFVSALEAADQAAREIKGHSASPQPTTRAVDETSSEVSGAEASEDALPSPRRITIEPFIVPPIPRIEPARHSVLRPRPSAPVTPTRSAVDEFLETVAAVTEAPFLAAGPVSPEEGLDAPLDVAEPRPAPVRAFDDSPEARPVPDAHTAPLAKAASDPPANNPQAREAAWRAADRGTPTSWPALAAIVAADTADNPASPALGDDSWLESLEGIRDDLELLAVLNSARSDTSPAGDPDPIAEFMSALAVPDPIVKGDGDRDTNSSELAESPLAEVAVVAASAPRAANSPAPSQAPPRQGRRNKKSRKHRAPEPPPAKVSVQNEWGFFDPAQCGFSALLAKLDELSSTGGDASWSR